eukprot:13776283-Alexandrium_andersonii.AAC.1
MSASLVGSEMCIRDSLPPSGGPAPGKRFARGAAKLCMGRARGSGTPARGGAGAAPARAGGASRGVGGA